MNLSTCQRRLRVHLEKSVSLPTNNSLKLRKVAMKYLVLKLAQQNEKIQKYFEAEKQKVDRKNAFTEEEEDVIVITVQDFAKNGNSLSQRHLEELVSKSVEFLGGNRKSNPPFKNDTPRVETFFHRFEAHLKSRLKFQMA